MLALTNFILFPLLSKRHSPEALFIYGVAALAPLYAATPFIPHFLSSTPHLLWPALVAHNSLIQGCSTVPFTSIFLIINSSCVKDQRGRVNGLGMTLSSIFKACGPPMGATVFAWSLTNHLGPPFNIQLVFFAISLASATTALTAWRNFKPVIHLAPSHPPAMAPMTRSLPEPVTMCECMPSPADGSTRSSSCVS